PLEESEWEWSNLRNWGGESLRSDAKNCFYPIIVKDNEIIGVGDVCEDNFHPGDINVVDDDTVFIYPVDNDGVERKWRYANDTVKQILERLKVVKEANGKLNVKLAKVDRPFKSMWYETKHNAGDNGTKVLTNMGFAKGQFDFPKSVYLVKDCLSVNGRIKSLVVDYFAGSGTTGHATIK